MTEHMASIAAIPVPTTEQAPEQKAQASYLRPALIVYGPLLQLAQGSGGNDYDGCSSGYYEAGEGT